MDEEEMPGVEIAVIVWFNGERVDAGEFMDVGDAVRWLKNLQSNEPRFSE